jgi:TIR domain/Sel1 repeat
MQKIFISCSSKDKKAALTICEAIEARGYSCWISSRDIDPGENFQEAIVKAIRNTPLLILVFSANSNNSGEIKKEIALASQNSVTVIPVRVEDVIPSDAFVYEFATRQWIDLFGDWERAMKQLLAHIARALPKEGGGQGEAGPPPEVLSASIAQAVDSAAPSKVVIPPQSRPSEKNSAGTASGKKLIPVEKRWPLPPWLVFYGIPGIVLAIIGIAWWAWPSSPSPVVEGAVSEIAHGDAAENQKDYGQAMQWYQKAAAQGDPNAEYDVGILYDKGLGVPQDRGQAMQWFQKAAARGDAPAEYKIGQYYRAGLGVAQDYGQAMQWFQKAAALGNAEAENGIGTLYGSGAGVTQDYGQAMQWFQKAAAQGNAVAELNIGALYENGWGIPRDYSQAIQWYQKAAAQGNATAQSAIEKLKSTRAARH